MVLSLREYQIKTLELMNNCQYGSYLINLATGLGKTIIFTQYIKSYIKNNKHSRVLILAHREELVNQPIKYLDNVDIGVEMAGRKSEGQQVIIASVQSLTRRLNKFNKEDFDIIITDECHHSPANSYMKIYEYFDFRLHFGFTATPNRNDCTKLNHIFDKILIVKDMLFGIKNAYLSNIECKRFYINYDLSNVKTSNGDFDISELDKCINTDENSQAIADIYKKFAVGRTLIFGVSVDHCKSISKLISESTVVSAETKNRNQVIKDFTAGKIKCIVNCMIFTEGTDIPLIESIIIARPTKNRSLYTQMVGRGLRVHPDKQKLYVLDCVGLRMPVCSVPTLLGYDLPETSNKPRTIDNELSGDLFELGEKIEKRFDKPEFWKINYKIVENFMKSRGYQFYNLNFIKLTNGNFVLNIPDKTYHLESPDALGEGFQEKIDEIFIDLQNNYKDQEYIWNMKLVKRWGRKPASDKQRYLINSWGIPTAGLTALEAQQIIAKRLSK